MEIYVVQPNDTFASIAQSFHILQETLIADNGLAQQKSLVPGQALVISPPAQSHVIAAGDTLQSIADLYQVSIMKLLQNNPFLATSQHLTPGQTITVRYNTLRSIATNGFAYPHINHETLIKTLPSLTYLTIFNYTIKEKGTIISYGDDSVLISACLTYGVVPLMMISTASQQGDSNMGIGYRLLLSESYQDDYISQLIKIMKEKGYRGLNFTMNFINQENQDLYKKFTKKISDQLKKENLLFFITINYYSTEDRSDIWLEQIDYSSFAQYAQSLMFVKMIWGTTSSPPAPISSIQEIESLIHQVSHYVSPEKLVIAQPTLGYDWTLPFIPGRSYATALTTHAIMEQAYNSGVNIEFDETSQSPYFYYNEYNLDSLTEHVIWFIDPRSINALAQTILSYDLEGVAIWNIMVYNAPLWTIINSLFDVIKEP